MNPPALLSEAFSLTDSMPSEGEYISHVTGFATDDDNSQRVGGLASMPDTNGVRYHAPQPVMQDLQYSGSSALAMTPPDSCPGKPSSFLILLYAWGTLTDQCGGVKTPFRPHLVLSTLI
ncbi:hypothetical protein N7535_004681 [Penicillium sp. DV-2018c]|nr:hypothetical protein N7461_008262 [Penicillium sp. DV-2018c]KAJ5571021.1 hypothetical protein N7535_004681 [Penicillium sp. DV-2018c]